MLDRWKGRVTNVYKLLLFLRIALTDNSFYLLLFLSSKVLFRHLRENISLKKYIFKERKKKQGKEGGWDLLTSLLIYSPF